MVSKQPIRSQAAKCFLCGKSNNSSILICNHCQKNPFNVDELRERLIKSGHKKSLQETYTKNYDLFKKNKNTKTFWDYKFKKSEELLSQDEMTKNKIDQIAHYIPTRKVKILDLGIGQGYLEQKLKADKKNHSLFGIDISERSINYAKQKFNGKFITGDILHIDSYYSGEKFDFIVAIEVIEHIFPHDILGLYNKIYTLLKENGKLIISTPLNENLSEDTPNPSEHVRQYTVPILKSELDIAGFKTLKYSTFFAFNRFYKLKKMISKSPLNKWEPNNVVLVAKKR